MMVHDLKELQETTNQILLEDVKDQLISIKESVEGVHYTVVDFRDTVKHT